MSRLLYQLSYATTCLKEYTNGLHFVSICLKIIIYRYYFTGGVQVIHTWTTQVRSYELDMHRHVNNATYLNYFEAARMDFLNTIGFDYKALLEKGLSLFVAKIQAHYKAPAYLNDEIFVTTESVKRKRFSGVFRQIVYREGTELCTGDITWACVNNEGKPVPLPDEFELPELQPRDKDIPV